uniref:uncharacterized protein LOC122587998 n=1 Tax=Erigeron canadensis TaxID=72917 RepID=UPI001CB9A8D7|nr:uncharacterized protein LOC122587998 [Erigeron canadensis]
MSSETKSTTKTKTKTKLLTTLKASQFRMNQLELGGNIITKNGGESSFRVLYYGDASAGSIPFMWELHPGTPKHATIESTPPPLTPPPALLFHHKNNEKYNMNNNSPNKQSLRTLFRTISARKSHVGVSSSDSSISYDSSKQSTSLRSLFLASSSSREVHVPSSSFSLPSSPWTEDNGGVGGDDDDSPTSTLCFGGGFMNRRKKMKSVIGSHGKTHKKKFISFY